MFKINQSRPPHSLTHSLFLISLSLYLPIIQCDQVLELKVAQNLQKLL